jgi:hypothetical protein
MEICPVLNPVLLAHDASLVACHAVNPLEVKAA